MFFVHVPYERSNFRDMTDRLSDATCRDLSSKRSEENNSLPRVEIEPLTGVFINL